MRFLKHVFAAAILGFGSVANAATITDNDASIELGSTIESFSFALFTSVPLPIGTATTIAGNNPGALPVPSAFTATQAGMGPFTLSYSDSDPSVLVDITGSSTQVFQDVTRFEALFTTASADLVLLEFLFSSPFQGSATLFEVNETSPIPLPAGLPLMLGGMAGFAWLRRKQRT